MQSSEPPNSRPVGSRTTKLGLERSQSLCDYIIPFCDAVVLSVGTLSGGGHLLRLQIAVWKGALFAGLEKTGSG